MSLSTVSIRKPFAHEEELFVELCVGLTLFNHSHAPIADLEAVLSARTAHAKKLFQDQSPDQLILFAVLDDTPVGYAYTKLIQPEPWVSSGTGLVAFLDELFLRQESRGHQLGQKLLHEVQEWAQAHGAEQLRLEMFQWNDGARSFYEREGLAIQSVMFSKNLR